MKYLGSKSRIANDILPVMLSGMKAGDTFVDAFCGGCNLLDKVPTEFHRIGNDKNKYLIAMWVRLTHYGWIPPTKISRELYSKYRDYFNEKRSATIRQYHFTMQKLAGMVSWVVSTVVSSMAAILVTT